MKTTVPTFEPPGESAAAPRATEPTESPARVDQARTGQGDRPGDQLSVPRRVVYFQAGLLGVVACSFFLFGMMVGNVTAPAEFESPGTATICRLQGSVFFTDPEGRLADYKSVVIIVPQDGRFHERPDPSTLRPGSFQPVENPAIDAIRDIGGEVTRVDRQGNFETTVASPREYFLLVISNSAATPGDVEIPKQQRAEMGSFFFPVEKLVGSAAYRWQPLTTSGNRHDVPPIVFGEQ